MILYHFTDIDSLPSILHEGLRFGNLNTARASSCEAGVTWLTTMDTPKGHGLTFGEPVTLEERRNHWARYRQHAPTSFTHWPDKSRVRIKVVIPSTDRRLVQWARWRGRLAGDGALDLAHLGDATRLSSRSWYLYFGLIEPRRFAEVLVDGSPYIEQKEAA